MHVETIETASLGDRSYLVHDGALGLVIDPQRDIDRVVELASSKAVKIVAVAETHVHNDYVSGGLTLSRVTGAEYYHAAAEPLRFDHEPVTDGDTFDVGTIAVRVVHTPGHTHHHLAYVATGADGDVAAFTGGSMLYGTVGRTDLISPDAVDELTRAQYRSVNRLSDLLPPDAAIYPTHGFGSFCASAQSTADSDGTLAGEQSVNLALTAADEDAFVEQLVAGLDAFPAYYAHMGPMNLAGASAADLTPPAPVEPTELARRIHRGEWVIDLRPRGAFAAAHVAGTIGIELGDSFSTYLAWLLPWGMPITLLAESPDAIAEAQRQMIRVGLDRPSGASVGEATTWVPDTDRSSYPVTDFASLDASATVLDVRLANDYAASHLEGAIGIPLHEVQTRFGELPPGPISVHCASGYRASIAASLLDRAGVDVVLIDDYFANAEQSGRGLVPS